ncbi:MAG: NAD(P)-dependent oxidoreductase [Planctomycetes bacterium]|nr:NAD(P)-dependent oxidoreductase [Planctomycetota bacterium]
MNILITGGCGFIGAWILRRLIADGDTVTVIDAQPTTARWEMLLSPAQIAQVRIVQGRIDDRAAVAALVREVAPQAIIHLAGLQVPSCKADPIAGAMVNVVGSLAVFEAAKPLAAEGRAPRIVYASSAAVFGSDADYAGTVDDLAKERPGTHYGAFKLCIEHCARAYWENDQLASVGLRPLTVYGPGRDTGMTSFPTRAIAAALLGQRFDIPFSGPTAYIHAREVAEMFIACARGTAPGAAVYTVGGDVVDTPGFIRALATLLPQASGLVTCSGGHLPIASRLDDAALRRDYPGLPRIPLAQGIEETIAVFRALTAPGALAAAAKA